MFSARQRLTLSLLALLAVGWAQTVGIHRGWLCDHGDAQFITQVDHMHGPHSAAQHEQHDHSIPHQHEEDEDDGDTHPLPEVKDTLLAKQQDTSALTHAFIVQPLIAEISWHMPRTIAARPKLATKPPDWPLRLTQSISLRI
jgi:hypothetical protein